LNTLLKRVKAILVKLSATWSAFAVASPDLLLVTKDGVLKAHCALLLPLSDHLKSLVEAASSCCGPVQVFLPEVSFSAMAAVKDLIYKGICQLEKVNLSEILETFRALGIKVMLGSFGLEMGPRLTQGNLQAIAQDYLSTATAIAKNNLPIEDPTRPFPCTQCPKRFRMKHGLKTHMLIHSGETPFSCHLCPKSFNRNYTLQKHLKVHSAGGKIKELGKYDPSSKLSVHKEPTQANQKMEVNEQRKDLWLPLTDESKSTLNSHTEPTNQTQPTVALDEDEKWQCEMLFNEMEEQNMKGKERIEREEKDKKLKSTERRNRDKRVNEEKMRVKGLKEKLQCKNNENRALPKVASFLADEICLDEIPQGEKEPKKVISTKDRQNISNFFNMKEKERKEHEEKGKSKKMKSKEGKKESEKRDPLFTFLLS